jgi:hypothetical protein
LKLQDGLCQLDVRVGPPLKEGTKTHQCGRIFATLARSCLFSFGPNGLVVPIGGMTGPALWRLLLLVIVVGLFILFTGRYGLHPFLVFVNLIVVFGAAAPASGFFEAMDDGVKLWFKDVGPSILLSIITGWF